MFIGRFAVGLASKRVALRAPLDTTTLHVLRIGFALLDTISKRRLNVAASGRRARSGCIARGCRVPKHRG